MRILNHHNDLLFQSIIKQANHCKQYESSHLQSKAKSLIPIKVFQEAENNFNKFCQLTPKNIDLYQEDFLVLSLLKWFKIEFFEWYKVPNCGHCNSPLIYFSNQSLSPKDFKINDFFGVHSELYQCPNASNPIHSCYKNQLNPFIFPRINDPEVLLESRTGRCGEWANCFTLFLRAVGLHTRFVIDSADHVWCEYYSISQDRWIHVDPCEGILDKPLMYSLGWKKQLSYVMAFDTFGSVTDVTWRYINDYAQCIFQRRNQVSELTLYHLIKSINDRVTRDMNQMTINSNALKLENSEVERRRLKELVEFLALSPEGDDVNGVNYEGRISGDQAWKIQRGEVSTENNQTLIRKEKASIYDKINQLLQTTSCKKHSECIGNTMEPYFSTKDSSIDSELEKNKIIKQTNDIDGNIGWVICPTLDEKGLIHDLAFTYSCANDTYFLTPCKMVSNCSPTKIIDARKSHSKKCDKSVLIKNLSSTLYTCYNIVRKTEKDWSMCYVCTEPNAVLTTNSELNKETSSQSLLCCCMPKLAWKISAESLNVATMNTPDHNNPFKALIDNNNSHEKCKTLFIKIKEINVKIRGTISHDPNLVKVCWWLHGFCGDIKIFSHLLNDTRQTTNAPTNDKNNSLVEWNAKQSDLNNITSVVLEATFQYNLSLLNKKIAIQTNQNESGHTTESNEYKLLNTNDNTNDSKTTYICDQNSWQKGQIFRGPWTPPKSNLDCFLEKYYLKYNLMCNHKHFDSSILQDNELLATPDLEISIKFTNIL